MKTYQITYWQTIYETVEVEAKDEDEAMEIFYDGDNKIISSKIKTEDIDEVKEVSKKQMDKKDQLTPEEYKRVIHVLTPFTLGRRVDDQYHFRVIRAKLKRQLASLENNGWYS